MLAVASEAFGHRLFLYMLSLQTFGQLHFIMRNLFKHRSLQHFISFGHFGGVAKMMLCALYQLFDHGLKLRLLLRA